VTTKRKGEHRLIHFIRQGFMGINQWSSASLPQIESSHGSPLIIILFIPTPACTFINEDVKGRFTPRGRANLLCKRLEILTCDWSKGSHWSQPLHTYRPGRFGNMFFYWKMYVMTRPELVELGAPKMEGQCHISLKKASQIKYDCF
jgi:hypothetical protein